MKQTLKQEVLMSLDRVRYEIKLAAKALGLTPLALLAPVGLLVLAQHVVLHQSSGHVLLASVEMLLPTAASVIVTATLAHDAAAELQLSMPRPYHTTGMLRLALISGWMACLAALTLGGMDVFRLLYVPRFAQASAPWVVALLAQLLWLAPLAWMVGVGLCLALLTTSRTASGALIGGIWLLDVLFVGTLAQTVWLRPFLLFPATLVLFPATDARRADVITYWLDTRLELLAMAAALLVVGWLLLHDTEGLLKGATEE
jgi:hypothetical protein